MGEGKSVLLAVGRTIFPLRSLLLQFSSVARRLMKKPEGGKRKTLCASFARREGKE